MSAVLRERAGVAHPDRAGHGRPAPTTTRYAAAVAGTIWIASGLFLGAAVALPAVLDPGNGIALASVDAELGLDWLILLSLLVGSAIGLVVVGLWLLRPTRVRLLIATVLAPAIVAGAIVLDLPGAGWWWAPIAFSIAGLLTLFGWLADRASRQPSVAAY